MAQIREHIAQLNKHFASHSAPIFHCFALDEDTVTFKVSAGAATGEVSVSLFELASYPRTGGLVFADGSDKLAVAVEVLSARLGEDAALDRCLHSLAKAVPASTDLDLQLAGLPAAGGARASASSSAGVSSTKKRAADDDDDDDNDDDDNDDDGGCASHWHWATLFPPQPRHSLLPTNCIPWFPPPRRRRRR